MNWVDNKAEYQKLAESIEPAAYITTKDSWLWTALWVVGVIFTLGFLAIFMPRKKFLEDYSTTVACIQGYSRNDPYFDEYVMVHECRHTTHCVALGWIVPIVGWFFGRRVRSFCGLPFYALLYFVLILPVGLCIGRWLFELDADKAAWRWALKKGYTEEFIRYRAKRFGETVCGGAYLFPWPWAFGGVAAFSSAAEKVIAEYKAGK